MGRSHCTKPLRIWILGASICATLFLTLSLEYNMWAVKTYKDARLKSENTTYFGLWKHCRDARAPVNLTEKQRPLTTQCWKFGEGGSMTGIYGTPGFIDITRGFLFLMTIIMGISSVVSGFVMFSSDRPLLYWSSPATLTSSVIGIIILGVFLGKMLNSDAYKAYDMAWAFYYFLTGWFFTLSSFSVAVTDRPVRK